METKEIIEKLNNFCESFFSKNVVEMDVSLFKEAAERLEELEAELGKRTINDRPYEWISVEDEPFPGLREKINRCWNIYPGDLPSYFGYVEEGKGITHWMLIEPPKPKEPSFKDVFLKAFPKADIEDGDDGLSPVCRNAVFWGKSLCSQFPKCSECWNQPYFDEEGEGDADNSK